MVEYKKPKPSDDKEDYFAMVTKKELLDSNLTDAELRVYAYYKSQGRNFKISLNKTADHFKEIKSRRVIEGINRSLVKKGYMAIMNTKDGVVHFIGEDVVYDAYNSNKKYFDKKKERYAVHSLNMKSKTALTDELRRKGLINRYKNEA